MFHACLYPGQPYQPSVSLSFIPYIIYRSLDPRRCVKEKTWKNGSPPWSAGKLSHLPMIRPDLRELSLSYGMFASLRAGIRPVCTFEWHGRKTALIYQAARFSSLCALLSVGTSAPRGRQHLSMTSKTSWRTSLPAKNLYTDRYKSQIMYRHTWKV